MENACRSFSPNNKVERLSFLVKDGHTIYDCKQCGHRFLEIKDYDNHVHEVYSDDYFFEGGQGYPNYLEQKDILTRYGINYAKILAKYRKPGKVLDVGCAAGFILNGYVQSGWEGYGIEPNKTMVEYGRKNLHLDITNAVLESFKSTRKFDLISLIQVIGHLHDLDKSMELLNDLLNEEGYILVESWDMNSLFAKIMGKHWHEYSPPSVVNWFSDKTLTQLFSFYGFKLISKGRPLKKVSVEHGISLVKATTPEFYLKNKVLDFFNKKLGKYNLPYPPLDLKWYLFQKK